MDVLSERKKMIRPGAKFGESRGSWASRTWVLVAWAIFGNGCAARSVTDHYPDEIRKGRVLIAGRSVNEIVLKVPVFQDVWGERESVGKVVTISPTGESGSNGTDRFCLLAYAPPGKATFSVGSEEVTVDIYEGMTTPITLVVEPWRTDSLGGKFAAGFQVGEPINNLKIPKSGCPAWVWRQTHQAGQPGSR
jgi:hypothetical protein